MGDERYYTFYQFFSVILLVLLSMFVISSMFIGYHRNEKDHTAKKMLGMYLILSIIIILKAVELVMPNYDIAFFIRCLNSLMLILLIIYWLFYLNKNTFRVLKINTRYVLSILSALIIIMTIITKGQIIITHYSFFDTKFSNYFLAMLIAISIVVLVYIAKISILKNQIHSIYKNSRPILFLLIFMFLPISIYSFMISFNIHYLDFAEILIYIALAAMFTIIMYTQSPSGLTVLAFNKVGDIIQDYVFATDKKGRIIYKNIKANQSDYFTKNAKIDIENVKSIYRIEPELKKNAEGKEYVELHYVNSDYYFLHIHDHLKDGGQIIGHIITIIDITDLVSLLNSLEDKKQKSKEANLALKKYSEVVYHIEKEKEINSLVEKIISLKEKEMHKLIDMIDSLIKDDSDYKGEIDSVIEFNQTILEDIRKTVSAYRQHYGG